MPQMMPINWILLFIFFIIIFLMYNIMNYYLFKINFSIKFQDKKKKNYFNNWKW